MISQKRISIYTHLANKYNIPYQVVEVICNYPFKFANEKISNTKDIKPIMFSYLFKIKPKKKYGKEIEQTS
nr:MAG: DNA-binding protein [Bacteriophage sp.]